MRRLSVVRTIIRHGKRTGEGSGPHVSACAKVADCAPLTVIVVVAASIISHRTAYAIAGVVVPLMYTALAKATATIGTRIALTCTWENRLALAEDTHLAKTTVIVVSAAIITTSRTAGTKTGVIIAFIYAAFVETASGVPA